MGEECQDIPSKNPCLTKPKYAVDESFSHSIISGIEKVWMSGGGGEEEGSITIFCRKLLFHNAENFCRGTLLCCVSEKLLQRKILWIRRRVSRYSVESFLSHSAENFVGEPFIVSPIRVSKKLMFKRVLSRFFVEIFCLAVPKKFAVEPFCAVFPKGSGSE